MLVLQPMGSHMQDQIQRCMPGINNVQSLRHLRRHRSGRLLGPRHNTMTTRCAAPEEVLLYPMAVITRWRALILSPKHTARPPSKKRVWSIHQHVGPALSTEKEATRTPTKATSDRFSRMTFRSANGGRKSKLRTGEWYCICMERMMLYDWC